VRGPAALLVAVMVAGVSPAPSTTPERCTIVPAYEFYPVSGSSEQEIHASLVEKGPRDERGSPRFAFTDWSIEWDWKKDSEGAVTLDSVQLRCSATITLPRLSVAPGTDPALIQNWHDFVERTRSHELKHVQNVEQGAGRIPSRLRASYTRRGKLSPMHAHRIIKRVVQEVKDFDIEYDARTNHGDVEGTWRIMANDSTK
jgi:predicted secreted Zn-dependent protease